MNKLLYKLEIISLKFIPYILAILCFINTILLNIKVFVPVINAIGFVSPIVLIFLYISSYTFKFCEYHRIPLHYVALNNIFNTIDYWFQFTITDYNFILIHSSIFGIAAILCGILKISKNRKHEN